MERVSKSMKRSLMLCLIWFTLSKYSIGTRPETAVLEKGTANWVETKYRPFS